MEINDLRKEVKDKIDNVGSFFVCTIDRVTGSMFWRVVGMTDIELAGIFEKVKFYNFSGTGAVRTPLEPVGDVKGEAVIDPAEKIINLYSEDDE